MLDSTPQADRLLFKATAVRDHVLCYINGHRHRVTGENCFLSLSDYLRQRCHLVGTKIVCSEGDCGSCTVLIGRQAGQQFQYRPVDSCIQFMFQLDGTHVVTIEGIGHNGTLTPVQQAMIRCHGSQCGYCTPGFVVAMTGLLENRQQLDEQCLRSGLTGNLCRCTGYVPIIEAGTEVNSGSSRRIGDFYPSEPMLDDLTHHASDSILVQSTNSGKARMIYGPATLHEALQILAKYPPARIVAGATDVGVLINKGALEPEVVIDLSRVDELTGTRLEEGTIVAGARTTWTELVEISRRTIPELHRIASVFGAPQIRHVGTLGGNIVNASPIADSLPFLFVTEAELQLESVDTVRKVNVSDFYLGYKQLDLQPGELLTKITIPLPGPKHMLRLFKVSRRRDLDISTFTAALMFCLDGETIVEARIALGAVGPTVIRARQAEAFLLGKSFDAATMQSAGDVVVGEISPISDVRGNKDFRFQLARNVLLRFYHEQTTAPV